MQLFEPCNCIHLLSDWMIHCHHLAQGHTWTTVDVCCRNFTRPLYFFFDFEEELPFRAAQVGEAWVAGVPPSLTTLRQGSLDRAPEGPSLHWVSSFHYPESLWVSVGVQDGELVEESQQGEKLGGVERRSGNTLRAASAGSKEGPRDFQGKAAVAYPGWGWRRADSGEAVRKGPANWLGTHTERERRV